MERKQLINKWERELYRTRELTKSIINEPHLNPENENKRDYLILSMLMQDDRMMEAFIHDLKRMA
ncbi:hypothetical protein ACQUEF_01780 [Vagococcus fluvialis]|uniref:hypothetical protein n=1 Tax=Vagococcus fluvialis TaxID=2738 RepID=UPI003D1253D3